MRLREHAATHHRRVLRLRLVVHHRLWRVARWRQPRLVGGLHGCVLLWLRCGCQGGAERPVEEVLCRGDPWARRGKGDGRVPDELVLRELRWRRGLRLRRRHPTLWHGDVPRWRVRKGQSVAAIRRRASVLLGCGVLLIGGLLAHDSPEAAIAPR
jgi:hypothetical protein